MARNKVILTQAVEPVMLEAPPREVDEEDENNTPAAPPPAAVQPDVAPPPPPPAASEPPAKKRKYTMTEGRARALSKANEALQKRRAERQLSKPQKHESHDNELEFEQKIESLVKKYAQQQNQVLPPDEPQPVPVAKLAKPHIPVPAAQEDLDGGDNDEPPSERDEVPARMPHRARQSDNGVHHRLDTQRRRMYSMIFG